MAFSTITLRRTTLAATLVVPSLLTLVLLWLPFGFGAGGLIEEWGLLGLFNTYGPLPLAWIDGPLAPHSVRPLMPFTFLLGYLFSPDSFVAWHLLMIAALLVKGTAGAYLGYKVSKSPRWAAICGPLILLYPADTMVLSFRSLHINWAMALVLAGSAVFLLAEGRRRATSLKLGALAGLLVFLAACMYEAALTLVLLAPMLIWAREGTRGAVRWLRNNWATLMAFWSGVLAYGLYAVWAASKVASYQGSIAGGGRSALTVFRESFPLLFSIAYPRLLTGGWRDAAAIVRTEFASYGYLVAATVAIALASWALWSRCISVAGRPGTTPAMALRLLASGLAVCAMGYAPFLLLPSHQVISQRTFLWAAVGAAMALLALLMLLYLLNKAIALAATVLLVGVALGGQMFQFHHYANLSATQSALLRAIVANVDGDLRGKTLVIADETNLIGHTWTFPEGLLQSALAYLYGRDIGAVQICHMPAGEWVHADSLARRGNCSPDGAGWVFRSAAPVGGSGGYVYADKPQEIRLAPSQALTLAIHPDFSATLAPGAVPALPMAGRQDLTARRYRGALQAGTPWIMFRDQTPGASYRWNFGDWWSMEIPIRGTGWREAEWSPEGAGHLAWAWKTTERATLDFALAPATGAYRVRGKFGVFTGPEIRANLGILINGHAVAFKIADDGAFSADFPAQWLRRGVNQFAVITPPNNAYFGLTTQLVWFEVVPQ
jgi:hypothetical protein